MSELLIGLAILGVIATFSIPKVLIAQQNQKFNSIAKEAAGTIAGAYNIYLLNNTTVPSTLTPGDLTQYMNYVMNDNTSVVDSSYTQGTLSCATAQFCLKLHNGGMLYSFNNSFSGTSSTNAIYYYLDPDGVVTDGTTNGPGKAVILFLYTTGRVTSWGGLTAGTVTSDATRSACPGCDPPWFNWN